MEKQHITLSMEDVGHAIYEYVLKHHNAVALKIDYSVQSDMTDHAEPYPTCKLAGVIVTACS